MVIEIRDLQISRIIVHILLQYVLRVIALAVLIIHFLFIKSLHRPILVNKEFLKQKSFRFLELLLHVIVVIIIFRVEVRLDLDEHGGTRLRVHLLAYVPSHLGLLAAADEAAGEGGFIKSQDLLVLLFIQEDTLYHVKGDL